MGLIVSCLGSCACSALCNACCPVCCWCKYKDCFGFESVRTAKLPFLVLLFISVALAVLVKASVFTIEIVADLDEGCDEEFTDTCEENAQVYRISFSSFIFFTLLALVTRCSTTIHTHWWIPKVLIYFLILVITFFIPNSFFFGYVQLARILSGFYLLLQIIVLINFVYWLHTWLNSSAGSSATACNDVYLMTYLALSIISFAVSIVGIALIYTYFATPGCQLEQFFTSFTLILGLVGIFLSVWNRINMGLLTPCVVFLYCVYVLWDALLSDPDAECNPTADSSEGDNEVAIIVISLLIVGGSIVWTSYRTGEALLSIDKENVEDREEEKPANSYEMSDNMRDLATGGDGKRSATPAAGAKEDSPLVGMGTTGGQPIDDPAGEMLWLFHAILALASAYLSMALTNWGNTDGENEESGSNTTGETNVWVKIVSQWVTFALYYWTLTAPLCRGEDASA